MHLPLRLPLHGNGTPLTKLFLWVNMAALNPEGFREVSNKKNRHFVTQKDRSKGRHRGRFRIYAEKLALEL